MAMTNTNRCTPLLACVLVLGVSTPAVADDPVRRNDSSAIVAAPQDDPVAAERERRTGGHSKTALMNTYDTNGDRRVSIGEFMIERERSYAGTDADGNGSLSRAEYVGEFEARMDAGDVAFEIGDRERQIEAAGVRFGFMDSDENEIMTAAEYHVSGMRMFKRLGTNEDGFVDARDTAESF